MKTAHCLLLCLSWIGLVGSPVWAEITLLGEAQIAGDSLDKSGLTGAFDGGIPFNRLGGISAIEHVAGEEYILLSDRGPNDGAVPYAARFHLATIKVASDGSQPTVTLTATRLLTKDNGQPLIGAASALQTGNHPSRFDPEGCRLIRRPGEEALLAISDEYGPRVDLFDMVGKRVQKLKVPGKFEIDFPSADPDAEARDNSNGRQPNGGFEGLAISPDGKMLYAILQKPLLQDGVIEDGKVIGQLNRIMRIDLSSGDTAEFVYPLESLKTGISEILCVDERRALVLERDSGAGGKAHVKRLTLIDFEGATDVSEIKSLPSRQEELPPEIRPVTKRPFLDLLEPRFGISGEHAPAKFEGLTFGPDLADGRKSLLVAVDNDFVSEEPIRIYVFAVSANEFSK
jgi:hypothetical protein